jgi:hypothetical protein
VEVDRPELLAWKETRLPGAECPRPLDRLAIDFDREALLDRLRPLATDEPVMVVAGGLLPYLEPASVGGIFSTLATLFPSHTIVADVLSARFLARFGGEILPVLARHGLGFPTRPVSPRALFEDAGYVEVTTMSTLERMMRPSRFLRWLLRDLFDGSVVCTATRR